MGNYFFLTAFFGLFLAIGLGVLGYGLHSMNMAQAAAGWPSVQGTIVASNFEVDRDSDGDTFKAKVSYTYNVLGRELTGKRIAFGYGGSSAEKFHRDIHEALPVNTSVAVRYDPSDPTRAVLSYGVNQSIKFLLLFGGVWTMFILGMAAMLWTSEQGAGALLGNMVIYARG